MAAVTATVHVKGLKELDAVLARLPDEVSGPIMKDALTEVGAFILRAAQENITSRSGRTAADLRYEVQVQPGRREGAVAVGGTRQGRTGRAHVLRWLEFGTRPHKIVAGASGRREARRAARALRAIGERAAATALRRGIREGTIRVGRALKLPGGVFRSAVQHPGMRNQSPLTRALTENGDQAIVRFKDALWREIVRFTNATKKAA